MPARLAKVGDLWRALRESKPVDIKGMIRAAAGGSGTSKARAPRSRR
jgi:hypothetical protein